MVFETNAILPARLPAGASSRSLTLEKYATGSVTLAAGVAAELPSAVRRSGCGKGDTTSAVSSPRRQVFSSG